jgi:hypothetical protein
MTRIHPAPDLRRVASPASEAEKENRAGEAG